MGALVSTTDNPPQIKKLAITIGKCESGMQTNPNETLKLSPCSAMIEGDGRPKCGVIEHETPARQHAILVIFNKLGACPMVDRRDLLQMRKINEGGSAKYNSYDLKSCYN